MEDLLTTQQVQKLLKVNRITIYRMLQDGRLRGVKIGQQWRFPANQFDHLLSGDDLPYRTSADPSPNAGIPVHCVQTIQDMFAALGELGSVTVSPDGLPFTRVSHTSAFCDLILGSPSGKEACEHSWREICKSERENWSTCHAGLAYYKVPFGENNKTAGYLLTGQFQQQPYVSSSLEKFMKKLADLHGLDRTAIMAASTEIAAYHPDHYHNIEAWSAKYIKALESILQERTSLVERLQRIEEISSIS